MLTALRESAGMAPSLPGSESHQSCRVLVTVHLAHGASLGGLPRELIDSYASGQGLSGAGDRSRACHTPYTRSLHPVVSCTLHAAVCLAPSTPHPARCPPRRAPCPHSASPRTPFRVEPCRAVLYRAEPSRAKRSLRAPNRTARLVPHRAAPYPPCAPGGGGRRSGRGRGGASRAVPSRAEPSLRPSRPARPCGGRGGGRRRRCAGMERWRGRAAGARGSCPWRRC